MKKSFLETFEMDAISKMDLLVGGQTKKKDDCCLANGAGKTKWGKDSTTGTDTARDKDHCND